MAIKHVMPVLRAAETTLQNLLPGLIAAYNAEPATTVQLDVPDAARYFIPAEDPLGGGGGFPVIELFIGSGGLGPFDINVSKADVNDRAVVCLWHERDRGELGELYETITGYGRVLLEALLQDDAFGVDVEIANETDAVTYDYSIIPESFTNENDRDSFQKWRTPVVCTFKLEDVTDVP